VKDTGVSIPPDVAAESSEMFTGRSNRAILGEVRASCWQKRLVRKLHRGGIEAHAAPRWVRSAEFKFVRYLPVVSEPNSRSAGTSVDPTTALSPMPFWSPTATRQLPQSGNDSHSSLGVTPYDRLAAVKLAQSFT
jgi:hypothetical protein